jgi:hypothetical protein
MCRTGEENRRKKRKILMTTFNFRSSCYFSYGLPQGMIVWLTTSLIPSNPPFNKFIQPPPPPSPPTPIWICQINTHDHCLLFLKGTLSRDFYLNFFINQRDFWPWKPCLIHLKYKKTSHFFAILVEFHEQHIQLYKDKSIKPLNYMGETLQMAKNKVERIAAENKLLD